MERSRRSIRWHVTLLAFLVWTAQPDLEARHSAGVAVVIFLVIATILGYFAYHQLWEEPHRGVVRTGPLDADNQAKTRRAKGKGGIAG